MSYTEAAFLMAEKATLERMIAETPPEDVLDLASLRSRLSAVETELAELSTSSHVPARVRLTFRGRPVVGSHGVFAEFGTKAVSGFADTVTAMAASFTAPLAAMGPIPGRDQHQLLITSTALGSFGFELEEHLPDQLTLDDETPVRQALAQKQRVLRGTLGTDDELTESASDTDRRAIEKLRGFLQTLADSEATCSVALGEEVVTFSDVGQIRTSIERLGQENFHEDVEAIMGALQGVLPAARTFEFRKDDGETIRGKLGPAIATPSALNQMLEQRVRLRVHVTRVGRGKPRYMMLESPAVEV